MFSSSLSVVDIDKLQDAALLLAAQVDDEGSLAVGWSEPEGPRGLTVVPLQDIGHLEPRVKVVASDDLLDTVSGGSVVQVVRSRNRLVNLVDCATVEQLDPSVVVPDGRPIILQQRPEHHSEGLTVRGGCGWGT